MVNPTLKMATQVIQQQREPLKLALNEITSNQDADEKTRVQ